MSRRPLVEIVHTTNYTYDIEVLKDVYSEEWDEAREFWENAGLEAVEQEFVREIIWDHLGGILEGADGFTPKPEWDTDDVNVIP